MLTFASSRSRTLRTSDLFAFAKLIKESLLSSWPEETANIKEHFADLKVAQGERILDNGNIELLVTLSPGTSSAKRLSAMIEQTMEERFLFLGDHYLLVRK